MGMRALLDFILPPRCRICAARTTGEQLPWVCERCWLRIEYVVPPWCAQCGEPLAAPPEGIATTAHRCGDCLLDPPPYAQARAVGLYHGVLRDVIHAMKYQGIYGLVQPLAALLYDQFFVHWGTHRLDALIPVPLHRSKLQQREFDQALALARSLSQRTGIPLWANDLIRQRRTASQVGLSATQRRQNVRGAFCLKEPQVYAGKALLLIDDVYTTGATLQECARLLQQAGAAWVGTYTLARVGKPQWSRQDNPLHTRPQHAEC
jgi:ComF family protein